MKNKPVLGIMTLEVVGFPPFPEREFYKHIVQAGKEHQISAIVFHPDSVDFATKTVRAFTLESDKEWKEVVVPLPHFIYDRCFYLLNSYYRRYKPAIDHLKKLKDVTFLGMGLKGKWDVFEIVSKHPDLSEYLPTSEIVRQTSQMKKWLSASSSVVLKPINGSLGAGIVKVSHTERGQLAVQGRNRRNKNFIYEFSSYQACSRFIQNKIRFTKYLIQPYLSLSTKQGIPFDLRILVQKNEAGEWSTTGKAIRMGQKNSITSNLHGGGRAYPFEPFMKYHYTEEQIQRIRSGIATIEEVLPPYLEQCHGPLVELGIDVGIDQAGKVWLIEANSKPGRNIFKQLQDQETLKKSELNPLYYAKYLMQSRLGG